MRLAPHSFILQHRASGTRTWCTRNARPSPRAEGAPAPEQAANTRADGPKLGQWDGVVAAGVACGGGPRTRRRPARPPAPPLVRRASGPRPTLREVPRLAGVRRTPPPAPPGSAPEQTPLPPAPATPASPPGAGGPALPCTPLSSLPRLKLRPPPSKSMVVQLDFQESGLLHWPANLVHLVDEGGRGDRRGTVMGGRGARGNYNESHPWPSR